MSQKLNQRKCLEFSTHIEKKDRKNMKYIYIYNVEDKMKRYTIYLI